MKKVDNLTVTMTYTVGYEGVEMPENIYKALTEKATFEVFDGSPDAMRWLIANIKQEDSHDWKFEIDDISD